ncbi:MAG: hypothetical protein QM781_04635 [Chitinophagaceae bacterium]
MKTRATLIVLSFCLFMTACNNEKKAEPETTATEEKPKEPAAPANTANLDQLPVSDKPLGVFPYITLPANYEDAAKNPVQEADSAYFWVVDHFEAPKGKVFFGRIKAKGGSAYSDQELLKAVQDTVTALGGFKVSDMTVPDHGIATMNEQQKLKHNAGYGFLGFKPTATYVIRRAAGRIWVQVTPTDDGVSAGWIVLEEK